MQFACGEEGKEKERKYFFVLNVNVKSRTIDGFGKQIKFNNITLDFVLYKSLSNKRSVCFPILILFNT